MTLVIADDGYYEVRNATTATPGMIGLYLASITAKFCMSNPSTQAERIAFERELQKLEGEDTT